MVRFHWRTKSHRRATLFRDHESPLFLPLVIMFLAVGFSVMMTGKLSMRTMEQRNQGSFGAVQGIKKTSEFGKR